MDLNTLWFVLVAVLYIGFFILEGFDFGVGILLPFLSRDKDAAQVDLKRRMMINTIAAAFTWRFSCCCWRSSGEAWLSNSAAKIRTRAGVACGTG